MLDLVFAHWFSFISGLFCMSTFIGSFLQKNVLEITFERESVEILNQCKRNSKTKHSHTNFFETVKFTEQSKPSDK